MIPGRGSPRCGTTWPRADGDVLHAVERLKRAPGASLYALPEIGEIAAGIAAVVFRPGNQNLMVSRRKAKDGEWIIIHNRTLDAVAVGRWTVHGRRGEIARFDAEQGRYFTVPFAPDQDGLEATLDMPPGALWCLRLGARVPETAAAVAFQYREDFKTDFPWGNRERLAGPGFTPESDSLGGVAASGDTGYSRYAVFRVRGRD